MTSALEDEIAKRALQYRRTGRRIGKLKEEGRGEASEFALRDLIADIVYETDPAILHQIILDMALQPEDTEQPKRQKGK